MSADTLSIEEIEHAIEVLNDRLALAPYINSTARMIAEEDECKRQIAAYQARLVELRGQP